MAGYTAFITYLLLSDSGSTDGSGYSNAIHCNYINSIGFDNLVNKEFNIYFEDVNDFKFLSPSGDSGYTAHKIYVLTQLLENDDYDSLADIKPQADKWIYFDVTDQVSGYSSGNTITAEQLTSNVFRVPINNYFLAQSSGDIYDLSYLNYPSNLVSDENKLCFGDETYFMGNVTSSVEAIAYTTDLAIKLPLDEFNSTTNTTWDQQSEVYITEIGIYDVNKNLVGIAKLNNPIPKDSTISRTILFGLDF